MTDQPPDARNNGKFDSGCVMSERIHWPQGPSIVQHIKLEDLTSSSQRDLATEWRAFQIDRFKLR